MMNSILLVETRLTVAGGMRRRIFQHIKKEGICLLKRDMVPYSRKGSWGPGLAHAGLLVYEFMCLAWSAPSTEE